MGILGFCSHFIPGFKKNTQLKDQIHCVCIVIDGSTAGVLPDKLLEKIKAIQTKVHQKSKYHTLIYIIGLD